MAKTDDFLSEIYEKRRRRRWQVFLAAIFLAFYILIWGGAFLILRSPFLQIQEIKISGNQYVPDEEIITLLQSRIFGNSFWKKLLGFKNILIWPNEFSADDLKLLPLVRNLMIEKDYRRRAVLVKVEERQPFGIWCLIKPLISADGQPINADNCWWFDDQGVIFKKSLAVEGNLIRVVSDYSQGNLGFGSRILPEKFIQNLFSIFRVLEASGLSIKEIRLKDLAFQEIDVDTYGGPKIFFSMRFPADNDLEVIKSLANQPNFQKLQYIDFRVENRAYYK